MTPAYADLLARQQEEKLEAKMERRRERAAAKVEKRYQRQQGRAQREASFQGSGVMNKAAMAAMGFTIGMAIGEGINAGVKSLTGKDATTHLEDWMVSKFGDPSDPDGMYKTTHQRGGAKFVSEFSREQERIKAEVLAMGGSLGDAAKAADEYAKKMREAGKLPPELVKHEREREIAQELGVTFETVKRLRQQGVNIETLAEKNKTDDGKAKTKAFLEKFQADERAQDAALTEKEAIAKKNRETISVKKQMAEDASRAAGESRGLQEMRGRIAAEAAARAAGVTTTGRSGRSWSDSEEAAIKPIAKALHEKYGNQDAVVGQAAQIEQAIKGGVLAALLQGKIQVQVTGKNLDVTGAEVGG